MPTTQSATIQSLLEDFFALDPEAVADEGVFEFLSGFLADETMDEEPEQLEMYLTCYSPRFAALDPEGRSGEVASLLREAGALRTKAQSPNASTSPNSSAARFTIGQSVPVEKKRTEEEILRAKTDEDDLADALAKMELDDRCLTPALDLLDLLGLDRPSPSPSPSHPLPLTLDAPAPSLPYLAHILKDRFKGDTEAAAMWMLEKGVDQLKSLDLAWRRQLAEDQRACREELLASLQFKKTVVEKFSEVNLEAKAVPAGPVIKPLEEKNEKVRYLDGQVVSTRGEKVIVIKTGEEWDGGSRGKVYTKGKRGKGFH